MLDHFELVYKACCMSSVCQSSSSQAWCTPVVWYPGLLDQIWTSKPEYHLHIHAPAAHEIVSGDGVGECK